MLTRWNAAILAVALFVLLGANCFPAARGDEVHAHRPRHDAPAADAEHAASSTAPSSAFQSRLLRTLLLRDYNTRVVLLGTLVFGACAGTVGTLMLLRKRALMGDVVSHAGLPGVALSFVVLQSLAPAWSRSLWALLVGAAVTGVLSILCVTAIRRLTKVKEDAALAIVLSVFFGIGVALFTVVQKIPAGSKAGLHEFIFGKAGALIADDVWLIASVAGVVLIVCGLLFKELALLCFDARFAASEGWPVVALDLLLLALVVCVAVIGMQSVGLLLVVAMLVIPPAAARFWSDHLPSTTLLAAVLGGASAYGGVSVSAVIPRLATGAIIVLAAALFFLLSLLLGTKRGLVRRLLRRARLRKRLRRQHLLRACYEYLESRAEEEGEPSTRLPDEAIPLDRLFAMRSWSPATLQRAVREAVREELVERLSGNRVCLTDAGLAAARRVTRNHRLWELYLIHHADIAPSHVDRDADQIEHVLDPQMISSLEALLAEEDPLLDMPASPHRLASVEAANAE